MQTNNYDGRINTTKKKSPYITQLLSRTQQKNNWRFYKKIISGKLTIEAPNPRPKDFYGYIKLTKDPKVESLNFENFIPRGSVIKTSGWIFGMVVYAGMKTKIMLNTEYDSIFARPSSIETLAGYLSVLSYAVWLVLFAINSLAFNFVIPKDLPTVRSTWAVFKLNVLIFALAVPVALYTLLDLFCVIEAVCFKRRFGSQADILDSRTFPNLGSLDFALLDKTGTLTTGNFKVEEIITDTSKYQLNLANLHSLLGPDQEAGFGELAEGSSMRPLLIPSEKKRTIQNRMKEKLTKIAMTLEEDDIYPKILNQFEIDDGLNYAEKTQPLNEENKERKGVARRALESLRLNERHFASNLLQGEAEINQILVSFILCHEAQIGYDSRNNIFISHSAAKEEEVLHEFSKLCGWYIQRSNTKEKIMVRINTQPYTYHLVGINSFTYHRRRMSVVYRENQSDSEATVICKAHPRRLLGLMKLSQEDHDRFEDVLHDF